MKLYFLKFYFKFFFIPLTTLAFSDQNLDTYLDTLEKEMMDISCSHKGQPIRTKFATARPNLTARNWWIFAGFLYWHPRVEGTAYAMTKDSPNRFFYCGKYHKNHLNWNQGFKGGCGYKTSHDDWDLIGRYTRYQSNSCSKLNDFSNQTISLKWPFSFPNVITQATSIVTVSYHTIDLEITRNIFLSQTFAVKPYLSIKGTSIDLKQKILYTNKTVDFGTNFNSTLQAIGPRLGIDCRSFMSNRMSFYVDLATAILYGHFRLKETNTAFPIFVDPEKGQNFKQFFKDHLQHLVHFNQIAAGLEWNKPMHHQKQWIHFKAGYEVRQYSKASPLERFILSMSTMSKRIKQYRVENILFHGIHLEVRFDF